jgi:hypothetical protein
MVLFSWLFFIPTIFVPTVVRNVPHNHVRHDIVSGRGISCKNKCSLDSFIPLTSVQDIISLCPVLWIFVMVKNIWNYIWGTEFYISHENNTIYSKKGDQKWTIQRQRKHWEKSKKFLFSIRHLPCYSYSQFSKHFVGDRGKKIYVKEKRTINNWEINIS